VRGYSIEIQLVFGLILAYPIRRLSGSGVRTVRLIR